MNIKAFGDDAFRGKGINSPGLAVDGEEVAAMQKSRVVERRGFLGIFLVQANILTEVVSADAFDVEGSKVLADWVFRL